MMRETRIATFRRLVRFVRGYSEDMDLGMEVGKDTRSEFPNYRGISTDSSISRARGWMTFLISCFGLVICTCIAEKTGRGVDCHKSPLASPYCGDILVGHPVRPVEFRSRLCSILLGFERHCVSSTQLSFCECNFRSPTTCHAITNVFRGVGL
jgi:hypothetical protein